MGAKEIVYYETTKTYKGVPKGLRFKVVLDNSKHIDLCIKEGLAEETGLPISKLSSLGNFGVQEAD
ncbi:MAG: hypothetical protein MR852_12265 [Treponema sp.]|nr:hypothetical protein [Treponema sp.]